MYFVPEFKEPWYELHSEFIDLYQQCASIFSASIGSEHKDAIIKLSCGELCREICDGSNEDSIQLLKKIIDRMPTEQNNTLIWNFFDENLNLGTEDTERFRTEFLSEIFTAVLPEWVIAEAIEQKYSPEERIRYICLVTLKKLKDVWGETIPHIFRGDSQ